MILMGATASAGIYYHVNYSAVKLEEQNATRVTVTLSLYGDTSASGTVDYRATVGTLTQSSSKAISMTGEPSAFCALPNLLIFHDEAGRADASVSVSATFGGKRVDFSCKLTLESINRASTITTLPDGVAGERVRFWFYRKCLDFTHRVTLRVGTYETSRWGSNVAGETELNDVLALPLDEIACACPNASQCEASLTLTTYWGEVLVGTHTRTFTVTVPAREETLPSVNATLAPQEVEGFEGLYLQGKTPVLLTLSGEGKYGAGVARCEAVFEGCTYTSPTRLEAPQTEGELPITLRVTDTRGYTREEVRTITVHPYGAPRLLAADGFSRVSAARGEEGDTLFIAFGASIAPITVGETAKNTYTLQYRLRAMSETQFGALITLSQNAPFVGVASGVTLSPMQSYAVELSCIDRVGERTSVTFSISTEEVSFHLRAGGMGAAFGKYAEAERVLEIAPDWTLRLHGTLDDSVTLTDTAAYASGEGAPYCRVQLVGGKRVRFSAAIPFEGTAAQTLAEDFLQARALPSREVLALCPCENGAIACVSLDTTGTLTLRALHGEGDTTLHACFEYDAYPS